MDSEKEFKLNIGSIVDKSIVVGKLLSCDGEQYRYEAFDKNLNVHGLLEVFNTDDKEKRDLYQNRIKEYIQAEQTGGIRKIYRMFEIDGGIYVFADKSSEGEDKTQTGDLENLGSKIKGRTNIKRYLKYIEIVLACIAIVVMIFIISGEKRGPSVTIDHIIWEGTNGEAVTKPGKYQHDVGYFDDKQITYVDITYKMKSNRGSGTYYIGLEEVKQMLDETELDYALGTDDAGNNSIILRLPMERIGYTFPGMLDNFGSLKTGVLYLIDGINYPDSLSVKDLVSEADDISVGDNIVINCGEISGVKNGNKIVWKLDSETTMLYGTYSDGKIVFNESSFEPEKTLSEEAKLYIRLIKAKLRNEAETFGGNYNIYYNDLPKEEEFGLKNQLNEVLFEDIANAIEKDTEYPVTVFSRLNSCCVETESILDENLVKKTIDIGNSAIKYFENSDAVMYWGGLQDLYINPYLSYKPYIWSVHINFLYKEVEITYWKDNLKYVDESVFNEQLGELKNELEKADYFKEYQVIINEK